MTRNIEKSFVKEKHMETGKKNLEFNLKIKK